MRGQSKDCSRCVDLIHALKRFSHEEPETSNLTSEARMKFINEIDTLVMIGTSTSTQPKIQKVPAFLRQRDQQKFEKYYEPRWISIGPIHHGKPNLQLAEKYKLKWTAKFIADNQLERKRVYGVIENNIKELKECFDEQVIKNYDDGTLSLMLFMDGCSILLLMQPDWKEFNLKDDQALLVQNDLFLLENQIPFRVLDLVMGLLLPHSSKFWSSMEDFISRSMHNMSMDNMSNIRSESKPIHLLDLLRLSFVPPKDTNAENQPINQQRDNFTLCFSSSSATANPLSFRGAGELKKAGIYFRRSEKSYLGSAVKFIPKYCISGRLELPQLTVDDLTAPKFLNLIAYERCPDVNTDYEVSAYIGFLDRLIDYPNDVKELRKSRVLSNYLGSDEEVADLFNEISTDLVFDYSIYEEVIKSIEKHYNSKMRTWMAQVYHDHFSCPWSIVAFLAALALLVMTILQTWRALQ